MFYYQFNIGDYQSHTAHLSEMEDLAYRRLLDWCYLHEKPLPHNIDEVARLIRMRSHCDCITVVLREFFDLVDDGWISTRVLAEILKVGEKSEKASASAKVRWSKSKDANAMRTHTEGNATQDPIPETQDPRHIEPTVLVPSPKVERTPSAPISEIVEMFNTKLTQLPRCEVLNDSRKKAISARWRDVVAEQKFTKEQGLEWFSNFFDHIGTSKFLTGKVKPWRADVDFIFKPTSFARIVEGAYHKD